MAPEPEHRGKVMHGRFGHRWSVPPCSTYQRRLIDIQERNVGNHEGYSSHAAPIGRW
jgi:hypothetical protein